MRITLAVPERRGAAAPGRDGDGGGGPALSQLAPVSNGDDESVQLVSVSNGDGPEGAPPRARPPARPARPPA